ncbi:MAG: alanine--tRNA ligase, partial [Planctomycetota bacterium]
QRGHKVVPSSPVVPKGDPTLLFTNAGMNQFKDVFLGRERRDYSRAVSAQKCIRAGGKHNDLEQVGHTARHQTFFEMLGNFSFGDYFKREAISYAWDFLTNEIGLPRERLWISIYETDDEAGEIWREVTGFDEQRIVRLGEKDNFWQMGDTGPCGPCTEIHYDRGEQLRCSEHCGVGRCDCGRFLEVWNLVFMQYDRQPDGVLEPLPRPSVDTGMGLERLASIVQGVPTNFDIDLIRPLLDAIAERSGVPYEPAGVGEPGWERGVPHRVIADHLRTLAFAIADGALPSNEGAGYVLRRILRRAARYGRKLKIEQAFMHELVPVLVDTMADAYPELRERQETIARIVRIEEESFNKTIDRGLEHFERVAHALIEHQHARVFPGDVAFKLYDTYGFPPDLTRMLAREKQLDFDEEGFYAELRAQQERSRAAGTMRNAEQVGGAIDVDEVGQTVFVGYETLEAEAQLRAFDPERGELILDRTPFYAESGGQVGDRGVIEARDGSFRFVVEDTQKAGAVIVHRGRLVAGEPAAVVRGAAVRARVDPAHRLPTRRHHTATHLLHWALGEVLGAHARQAGSVVEPARLRFDFTHFEAVSPAQLREIETLVNERILADTPVRIGEMALEEAKAQGVTALFGEKYGERVRVVDVGGYSRELCGGTHVERTGEIGLFKIVQETAVQAGVRRIVAVCGLEALRWAHEVEDTLGALSRALKAPRARLLERVASLQATLQSTRAELRKARAGAARETAAREQRRVGPVRLEVVRLEGAGPAELRPLGAAASRDDGEPLVALFVGLPAAGGEASGGEDGKKKKKKGPRLTLLLACNPAARERGLSAVELLRAVTEATGGGGGGKPDFAQAGGGDPKRLEAGIAALEKALEAGVGVG